MTASRYELNLAAHYLLCVKHSHTHESMRDHFNFAVKFTVCIYAVITVRVFQVVHTVSLSPRQKHRPCSSEAGSCNYWYYYSYHVCYIAIMLMVMIMAMVGIVMTLVIIVTCIVIMIIHTYKCSLSQYQHWAKRCHLSLSLSLSLSICSLNI